MLLPPPGWYDDPSRLHRYRWWSGHQWTDATTDGASGPRANAARDDDHLVASGIVFAVLFPIIGIVLAIGLFARSEIGPGLAVFLTSIVSTCVFAAVLL